MSWPINTFIPSEDCDLVLQVGSEEWPLNLEVDEKGNKAWQVDYQNPIRPGMSLGRGTYADSPPDVDYPVEQLTWHEGFGLYETPEVQPRKAFSVAPMQYTYLNAATDIRFPNRASIQQKVYESGVDAALLGFNTNPVKYEEFGNDLLCAAGIGLYQLQSHYWVLVWNAGHNITDIITHDGKLYAALADGFGLWYSATPLIAASWAAVAATAAFKFAAVGTKIAKANGSNGIAFADDGSVAGNWSADYNVGDSGTGPTFLGGIGDAIAIGKSESLFTLDSISGEPQDLWPEMRTHRHVDNWLRSTIWDGAIYGPQGNGDLLVWSPSGKYSTHPRLQAQHNPEVQGKITSCAVTTDRLFMAIQGAYGWFSIIERRRFSDGQLIDHILAVVKTIEVSAMKVSTVGGYRLWISRGADHQYKPCFVILSTTEDPKDDPNCRWQVGTCSLISPRMSTDLFSKTKTGTYLTVRTEDVSGNGSVQIWLHYHNELGVYQEHDVGIISTNGEIHIPLGSPIGIKYRWVQVVFEITNNNELVPPKITSYTLHQYIAGRDLQRLSFTIKPSVGSIASATDTAQAITAFGRSDVPCVIKDNLTGVLRTWTVAPSYPYPIERLIKSDGAQFRATWDVVCQEVPISG